MLGELFPEREQSFACVRTKERRKRDIVRIRQSDPDHHRVLVNFQARFDTFEIERYGHRNRILGKLLDAGRQHSIRQTALEDSIGKKVGRRKLTNNEETKSRVPKLK